MVTTAWIIGGLCGLFCTWIDLLKERRLTMADYRSAVGFGGIITLLVAGSVYAALFIVKGLFGL